MSRPRPVYHRVPKGLRGDTLYPLNKLKEIYPDLYEEHSKKYVGREELLTRRIPKLNCLWNDLLMFSPVHPELIEAALESSGHERKRQTWFEFDANRLEPHLTLLTVEYDRDLDDYSAPEEHFEWFEPEALEKHRNVPPLTLRYYRETKGEAPLLFFRIPHILYLGSIPIDSATAIITT